MGKNEGLIYTYSVEFFEGNSSKGKSTSINISDHFESPEETKGVNFDKMIWQPVELETYQKHAVMRELDSKMK